MKQIIIALSGRKGSGKNTLAQHIRSYFEQLNLSVMEYSFADTLKEFCIETLGLNNEQCYGTDEQKNSPTQYEWDNAPDFFRWLFSPTRTFYYLPDNKGAWDWSQPGGTAACMNEQLSYFYAKKLFGGIPELKTGQMTGREIMQLFGTDLVRNTFGNVWAEATIRRIKRQGKDVSLITDNRFPNEVDTVLQQEQGFIIRLTRAPFVDEHPSERSLDGFNWDRDKCYVINNAEMNVEEQNNFVESVLKAIKERVA